ncbi:surfeit locus protein 6 homolog [Leptopilina boulardi]|uniref:surfeit locus protein 6 homolog n=1 Tax=Leptopilina boulardi TaxID=63433 RepID=UPI0021F5DC64|nr:surfeit locus protein 6 homolog [Leptopilina boulardi]
MLLKVSNMFNFKMVQQILLDEEKYISDVFQKMALPFTEKDSNEDNEGENNEERQFMEVPMGDKKVKRAQTFEELYARLDELKSKGRLDYRDRNLKKGLKSRIKKKSKKEERIMQKKLARTEKIAAASSKAKEECVEASKIPKQKPIFNSEGHMVFSKFDFSQVGTKRKLNNEKNSKKILQKIELKKQKVKELVENGEVEKADEIKKKEAWNAVLAKAKGEKLRDDPELLKKSIKREEMKKKHSAKKWESRMDSVQKTIQEKQHKRQDNIMKRKKEKKMNKLKKAAKKGRLISNI